MSTLLSGLLRDLPCWQDQGLVNYPTLIWGSVQALLTYVYLSLGSTTIRQWAQGNVYSGTSSSGRFVQASITPPTKPSSLLDGSGKVGISHWLRIRTYPLCRLLVEEGRSTRDMLPVSSSV